MTSLRSQRLHLREKKHSKRAACAEALKREILSCTLCGTQRRRFDSDGPKGKGQARQSVVEIGVKMIKMPLKKTDLADGDVDGR